MKYIHEREIWLVDLEPTKGIEMQKVRPCLVERVFNPRHLIIVPITSQEKENQYYFSIPALSFLQKNSFLCLSQIRTVDSLRLIRKLGEIPDSLFNQIQQKTAEVLQLLPQRGIPHNQSEEKNSSSGGYCP